MPDKEDISAATSPGEHGPRTVRAPHGTTLSCKGWQQEAAMRMLMNNLDPDVAERPADLVVYGGSGAAARSLPAIDDLIQFPPQLEDNQNLLVPSRKTVRAFR